MFDGSSMRVLAKAPGISSPERVVDHDLHARRAASAASTERAEASTTPVIDLARDIPAR